MRQKVSMPRPGKSQAVIIASWALVVLWAGVIFFMSSRSDAGLNEGMGFLSSIYQWMQGVQAGLLGPEIDVLSPVAHFCEYAVLGVLLVNALHLHMPFKRAVVLAILCASFYGVTDELHQLFVPGRMCDPVDWLVDTSGAALGSVLACAFLRRQNDEGLVANRGLGD